MWTAPTMCMNLLPLYRGLALTPCFRSSWSRTQFRAPFLSFLLRSRLSLSVSTSFVIVPQISDSQSKQNRKRNQDLEKKIWKAFLMFGVPLHPCRLSLSISASLPLGFRRVALLFSTISAGNRLLSVCTRLLIQELVCTDDGTPFTMLIKVAAARSRRETEQGSEENEREREREGEKLWVWRRKGGMEGLLRWSIPRCKQEPIMANRSSVVRPRGGREAEKVPPSPAARERDGKNKSATHNLQQNIHHQPVRCLL